MAKSAMATSADENSLSGRVMAWPDRVKVFYNDVRSEMRKVTSPSWKEVQATTIVVVVTVFIFGLYFFLIDNVIQRGVTALFNAFK